MSHRKSRKNFAGAGNYNFCYFLYFFDKRSGKADDFDERSGKADDCGTIRPG